MYPLAKASHFFGHSNRRVGPEVSLVFKRSGIYVLKRTLQKKKKKTDTHVAHNLSSWNLKFAWPYDFMLQGAFMYGLSQPTISGRIT